MILLNIDIKSSVFGTAMDFKPLWTFLKSVDERFIGGNEAVNVPVYLV